MHTYEVFLKPSGKDSFVHAGSLSAPDDGLAVLYARETYVRRGEGELAWVVRREHVLEVPADDLRVTALRRHSINDGHIVADRRRAKRAAGERT